MLELPSDSVFDSRYSVDTPPLVYRLAPENSSELPVCCVSS